MCDRRLDKKAEGMASITCYFDIHCTNQMHYKQGMNMAEKADYVLEQNAVGIMYT